jgi:hypothetical protein
MPLMPRVVVAKDSIEGKDFLLVSLQRLPLAPLDLPEVFATCFTRGKQYTIGKRYSDESLYVSESTKVAYFHGDLYCRLEDRSIQKSVPRN